ncbi:MAG: hypothetical protein J1E57_06930 [Prevotella sp.]|nr:hypothetical protein [Prevotella sp.]
MRQIPITSYIKTLSERYQEMLTGKSPLPNGNALINIPQRVEDLKVLFADSKNSIKEQYKVGKRKKRKNLLNRKRYVVYLEKLKDRLDNGLLILPPSEFENEIQTFSALLTPKETSKKIKIGIRANGIFKTFTEIIQETLCYKIIRNQVFPHFIRELNIKACVYCNSQYAVTDEDNRGYYQLDHWKPESKYPYLCVCFFNLQPCCASCNLNKRDDDREYHSIWNESNNDNELYRFKITSASLAHYILTHQTGDLKIQLDAVRRPELLAPLMDKLHINHLYDELKDVAEEVVWKRMAYDKGYYKALGHILRRIPFAQSEVNRFILGTYDNPNDIHKRPLTKLIQDVAKQLGVI